MKYAQHLSWPAVLVSIILIAVLGACGWQDTMAIYDFALVASTILVTIGTLIRLRLHGELQVSSRIATLEIQSMRVVLAGCVILVSVAGRQWVQLAVPQSVEAAYVLNETSRIRYAIIANAVYLWGWMLVLWAVRPRLDVRQWWGIHRTEALLVSSLMVVATAMRIVWLNDYPNIINGDEGLIGWWARTMFSESGPLAYTLTAMDGVGTFYLTLLRGLIAIFGSEVWVLRILPALAGSASIGSIYLLARQLYGKRIGMLSAVLLMFAHTHIHFSRQTAVSYIYAAFFLPILLWALWQLVATRRAWPAVVAAFMLSMHANFYVDAWAWAVLTVLILISWLIVECRTVVAASAAIGVYAGTALLGLGPQLIWSVVLPDDFFRGCRQMGRFCLGGYIKRHC